MGVTTSPEAAFRVVVDPRSKLLWVPGIRRVEMGSEVPAGPGSRYLASSGIGPLEFVYQEQIVDRVENERITYEGRSRWGCFRTPVLSAVCLAPAKLLLAEVPGGFTLKSTVGIALLRSKTMDKKLNFPALVFTFLMGSVVSYVLCIAGDLLFGWTMYQIWAPLLPGFTWPVSVGGFLVGLIWLVAYSLYGAALIVLPYNFLVNRQVGLE